MRQARAVCGIAIGGAVALLATQPSLAASTLVTEVRLNKSGGELKLTLETKAGAERPQVFMVSRGNDLVADIFNSQLSLNQGDSFRQENPMPGIASVVVNPLDTNSVRVTISGASSAPTGQVLQNTQQEITLGLNLNTQAKERAAVATPASLSPDAPVSPATSAAESPQVPKPKAETLKAPTPVAQTPKQQAGELEQTPAAPTPVAQKPMPQAGELEQTSAAPTPVAQTPKPQAGEPEQTPSTPTPVAQKPKPQAGEPEQTPAAPTLVAQTTIPQPVAPEPTQTAPTPAVPPPLGQPTVPAPTPDVLVPNPQITIDGVPVAPAGPAGAAQPVAPAPPFLPRAIAPPVGDIAISNISATAGFIDLGTGVRVPRLVLREAPVREVLALLARSAGLNLAFTDQGAAPAPGAPPGAAGGAQQTISLDLENEPVQDVFNYVLRISGLQANRVGRTIFVGSRLPDPARNLIARTLRLNQANAATAAGFLVGQGAEQVQINTQRTLTVVGEGAGAQRIENTQTQVQRLTATEGGGQGAPGGAAQGPTGALVLRGLAVSVDARLNTLTLIGEPRQIEIATALLTQLDLRQRQVAVNVKIVDVNLLGTDAYNASFSFGIGDSFFVNDAGAASFNYGPTRPPTAAQANSSLANPTAILNPYGPTGPTPATVFLDPNNPITVQGISPGNTIVNTITGSLTPGSQQPGVIPGPIVSLDDPLVPGFITFTPATNNTITISPNGTTTVTPGTTGSVTSGLPTLFQFPKRLLAALQAQITSGNAKILTDPTLVVQEGQTAIVNLTQEVFGGTRLQTQTDPTTNLTTQVAEPIIKNAGLILEINVQKIDDNGFISLTVNPTVSSISGSQNTPQGVITLTNQRQLRSGQIRLRDGQTLILSGIIQEADRTTVRKVPILGDIPILGALFRSTERANQRQEVIVLLTPQIIDDAATSSFGYSYTPGRDARQILQQEGVSP